MRARESGRIFDDRPALAGHHTAMTIALTAAKTKWMTTTAPNCAHFDGADWTHELEHSHAGDLSSLAAATLHAQESDACSFFFNMRNYMVLGRNGTFHPGDNVFFSGAPWLGSAWQADTHFVAEVYDTSDRSTRDAILERVRSICIGGHSLPSDRPVVGGMIFVDFPDAPGSGSITACKDALLSWDDVDAQGHAITRTVGEWFRSESNNRFDIRFVLSPANASGFVRMPKDFAAYRDHPDQIRADLQAMAGVIGDGWDVIYICLPRFASRTQLFRSQAADCSWSGVNEIVYLDASAYDEAEGRDWAVVVHETGHSLGLPDLYADGKRSYGWSMMCDMRTAWHLTGWEKLALGWVDVDDWLFVKRGLVRTHIYDMFAESGCKGVVVFDDANACAYVVERAQVTGRSIADRGRFDKQGLLFYRVELRKGAGQIVPLIQDWSDAEPGYGGAPLAPFTPGTCTTHRGVHVACGESGVDEGGAYHLAYAGRIHWSAPQGATTLRGDEIIRSKSGNYQLRQQLDGNLVFEVMHAGQWLQLWGMVPPELLNDGYGFFTQVERDGSIHVSQGTCASDQGKLVKSNDESRPTGHYFLYLLDTPKGCHVSVYSGEGPEDPDKRKQYDVFDYPDDVESAATSMVGGNVLRSKDLEYELRLQTDGNLALYRIVAGNLSYVWSAGRSADQLPKGAIRAGFDADGTFRVSGDSGSPWTAKGPITLAAGLDASFHVELESTDAGPRVGVWQGAIGSTTRQRLYDIYPSA